MVGASLELLSAVLKWVAQGLLEVLFDRLFMAPGRRICRRLNGRFADDDASSLLYSILFWIALTCLLFALQGSGI